MESDRDEFAEALGHASQFECLRRYFLEDGISLEFIDVLLPFLRPAQIAQVREEKINLEVEVGK